MSVKRSNYDALHSEIGIMYKFNEWKMQREMSEKHEKTIEDHVKANVDMAIDQADSYGGLEQAFNAFSQNVGDSVLEDGYDEKDWHNAIELFDREFKKKTGLNLR
jgi:hypothetical protein